MRFDFSQLHDALDFHLRVSAQAMVRIPCERTESPDYLGTWTLQNSEDDEVQLGSKGCWRIARPRNPESSLSSFKS